MNTQINTSFITEKKKPLVITPADENMPLKDLLKLLNEENAFFKRNILHYGGLLFRDFPINNVDDFISVIKGMQTGNFIDYIGGDSPRNKIKEGVYTSTEAPPSIKIPLHNELSFVKKYPKYIYFYCNIAPEAKGETIIADSREIYQSVNEKIKNKFIEKGLKYVSCYYHRSMIMDLLNKLQPSHKSWPQVFETDSKKDVEKKCLDNDFQYKWNQNDWLQISQLRPAIINHPVTQEAVWFNQAHLYDFNPKLLGWWRFIGSKAFYCQKHTRLHEIFFADNSRIPREDLYEVMDTLDKNTIYFPWKKGDILLLDNVLMMHGRETFTGKRKVLTAMTG